MTIQAGRGHITTPEGEENMRSYSKLTSIINPLPTRIFGDEDPWPLAVQEQLAEFIREVSKLQPCIRKTSKSPIHLISSTSKGTSPSKERNTMRKQSTCRIVINPIPAVMIGVDPWPLAAQEQLALLFRARRRKAQQNQSVNLIDVLLMLELSGQC